MTQVISIALGFILTTLVGGWWAAQLQERSWERQNDLRLGEEEAKQAAAACHAISGLLDKRIYRMRRVFWAIQSYEGGTPAEGLLVARLSDYNEILYEWNDRLNGNLALVGSHFGPAAKRYLYSLYEDFRRLGSHLEAAANDVRKGMEVSSLLDDMDPEFEGWHAKSLNSRVYLLCLAMMTQLRDGLVGRSAPGKLVVPSLDLPGSTT